MDYKFTCTNKNCTENNKVKIISMKMTEYTNEHFCPTCSEKLSRTVESLVSNYKGDKDFYSPYQCR